MENNLYNLVIVAIVLNDSFYANDLTSKLDNSTIAIKTPMKVQFVSAVEVMAVARTIFELRPDVIKIEVWHGIEFIKNIVRPIDKHSIIEVKANVKR